MELVLIPFLLVSGATLIYLGVHGTQPTPWALHGPHISTSSGERLPLPLLVERPASIAFETYETRESFQAPETHEAIEEMRPPAGNVIDEVGPARTFMQSDALIGQLMMELTTVRDELSTLRERVETLSTPAQPEVVAVEATEPVVAEKPAPKRRRTTKAAAPVAEEAVA